MNQMNPSINHSGTINLSSEELSFLNQVIQGQFQNHSTLPGVEIIKIDINSVPQNIKEIISQAQGQITQFLAVRIINEVPLHQHVEDGEIYFGGDKAEVVMLDSEKNEIGRLNMNQNSFSIVTPGEWHSVTSQSKQGTIFFGVKFKINNSQ